MQFESLQSQWRDDVHILWLRRGKGNALSLEFLSQLEQTLEAAAQARPRGLILSATGSIFCAGLDLIPLYELDRAGMEEVVRRLYAVGRALFSFPRPVVAALNGHAIAGGAYLALCCDLRLMAQGEGRFGLNESQLGLSMPAHCLEVVRYALPPSIAEQLLYGGQLYAGSTALEMGIVDEWIEPQHLLDRAVARILDWTVSPAAFADIKGRLKAPALRAMDEARAADAQWLDLWFSPPARQRVGAARQKLLGAKHP